MSYGDHSRFTFRRDKHYVGVPRQQGRVGVDADDNELDAIHHHLRSTAHIDMGLRGTAWDSTAFALTPSADQTDLQIGPGDYYVDGILCEQDTAAATLLKQPDPPVAPTIAQGQYVAYLDVWRRVVLALEDDHIREKALGGPDTCTRIEVVWQVKLAAGLTSCEQLHAALQPIPRGKLQASTAPPSVAETPCIVPPAAKYYLLANQLYRVEIHTPGATGVATYKWSRDNGAVVGALDSIAEDQIVVRGTGLAVETAFVVGQYVELVTRSRELQGIPGFFARIEDVEPAPLHGGARLTLESEPGFNKGEEIWIVRRWDGKGTTAKGPLALEGGVQIEFEEAAVYTTGDHWTIPARTFAGEDHGDIEWDGGFRPPEGIDHHYAPLARVEVDANKHFSVLEDCRARFPRLTALASLFYRGGDGQHSPRNGKLPQQLRVGVAAGSHPVPNARVRFELQDSEGTLVGIGVDPTPIAQGVEVRTGPDGLAACEWTLGVKPVQRVVARLAEPGPGHLPLTFTATVLPPTTGCAVTVGPDEHLATVLDGLGEDLDIHLCLQPGDFVLSGGYTLIRKRSVKITGSGPATRIHSTASEEVLRFVNCEHVIVRDLAILAAIPHGPVPRPEGPQAELRGALGFSGCGSVTAEGLEVHSIAALRRSAACISVDNRTRTTGVVKIRGCDLRIGHRQVGVLVVDATKTEIRDNTLRVTAKPRVWSYGQLSQSHAYLRQTLHGLFANPTADLEDPTPPRNAVIEHPGIRVRFNTPPWTRPLWHRILRRFHTDQYAPFDAAQLIARIRQGLEGLLREHPGNDPVDVRNRLARANAAVAAQGIVVAGRYARDVQIHGNTVIGALQAIHVGMSDASDVTRTADRVSIRDNTIKLVIPPFERGQIHGIFVGNSASTTIHDNHARAARITGFIVDPTGPNFEVGHFKLHIPDTDHYRGELDGIRVFGHFGHLCLVRDNHLRGFDTGVRLTPLEQQHSPQWQVTDNLAEGAGTTTLPTTTNPGQVHLERNLP